MKSVACPGCKNNGQFVMIVAKKHCRNTYSFPERYGIIDADNMLDNKFGNSLFRHTDEIEKGWGIKWRVTILK